MRFAVLKFPGSNCDQDCYWALRDALNYPVEYVWHKERSLESFDAVVIPGGFSFGDYLRCGAMAKSSPVMDAVKEFAHAGKLVIGICNGFQILCECGLLPGALIRNRSLHFVCDSVALKVESTDSPFTHLAKPGDILQIPVAHGEGCYYAEQSVVDALETNHQVLMRYVDQFTGQPTKAANPNGSVNNIAGICNKERNVFGLMPHPDRACDAKLGSEDGKLIFQSMAESFLASPK